MHTPNVFFFFSFFMGIPLMFFTCICWFMVVRLCLVDVKYFPERKIFSSIWLHFKKCFEKYFLVFGCVAENNIENTFSSCSSHFLTFSQFLNKYIIQFLNR